jgi:hypothetical protein
MLREDAQSNLARLAQAGKATGAIKMDVTTTASQ